jgi:hypothetical protein
VGERQGRRLAVARRFHLQGFNPLQIDNDPLTAPQPKAGFQHKVFHSQILELAIRVQEADAEGGAVQMPEQRQENRQASLTALTPYLLSVWPAVEEGALGR